MKAVVTPYVSFGETGSQLSEMKNVQQMINRYGRTPAKLILGSGLKWEQKEICVSSRMIFWTLKGLACEPIVFVPTESCDVTIPVSETLKLMDGNLVDRLITELRKENKISISRYHHLLLGKES